MPFVAILLFVTALVVFIAIVFAINEWRRRKRQEEAMAVIIHGWLGNISGIRAAAELVKETTGEKEKEELVAGIAHAADRLRASLETAMHDARIGSGTLHSHVQELDVPALLEEIVEDLAPLARIKHVELTMRCVDIPAALTIDRTAFEMSAYNVIENAIKYTDRGCIVVEAAVSSGRLTLTVADTGCGLPEQIAKGIFQKFCRTDAPAHTRGSGLGLYVVDQLVRAAGGSLQACRRTDGEGSTFTVTIPIQSPGPR